MASRARRRNNPRPAKLGTAVAVRPRAEVAQAEVARQPPVFVQTYGEPNAEKILTSYQQYCELAYGGNSIIFGLLNVDMRLFSEARFCWRNLDDKKLTYAGGDLSKLERPWPNGFTGELLARMKQDAAIAGTAYVRDCGDGVERLRPDWTTIVSWVTTDSYGRQTRQVIGYMYEPDGDPERDPQWFPVEEVATWAPIPDPMANWRGMSWLTPALREINADRAMTEHRQRFWQSAAPQPLDAKVLTPSGWSTMGAMRVGSEVIGLDGKAHPVTGVFPQGEQSIYRVSFTDGSATECTWDHVWSVAALNDIKRGTRRTMTLAEIVEGGVRYPSGSPKWAVPMADPAEFEPTGELPLDPYILGALLGDGSFKSNGRGSGGVTFAVSQADADEQQARFADLLPADVAISRRDRLNAKGQCSEFYFKGRPGSAVTNAVTAAVRALGLVDVVGVAKFIPDAYMLASVSERVALLQGLIDTDGSVSANGATVKFTNTSETLCRQLADLAGGLGGSASVNAVNRSTGKPQWSVVVKRLPEWMTPCRLARKVARYRPNTHSSRFRYIAGVELVGRKQAQCIRVDVSDSLYVTDDFIVTHNTPNIIIKYTGKITPAQKIGLAESIAAKHGGPDKAGGTLVLDEGADPMIVGGKFTDAQFQEVLAATENRMAVASGVPALLAGLKEGLDAAAWSMYRQAMRAYADMKVRPEWRSVCSALSVLVDVPEGHELWYDTRDIAALQESETESASRMQIVASTLSTLVTTGFTKESSVLAVSSGDETKLVDSGLVSVQLLEPGPPDDVDPDGVDPADPKPSDPEPKPGESGDVDRALFEALVGEISRGRRATERLLAQTIERKWSPQEAAEHPRNPADGEFVSTGGVIGAAVDKLKLAGRLPDGITLKSSRKLGGSDYLDLLLAEVDTPAGPRTRIGIVNPENSKRWDGGFRTPESDRNRTRMAEIHDMMRELEELAEGDVDEELYAELEAELEQLTEVEGDEESHSADRTVGLTPAQVTDLSRQLAGALVLVKDNKARQDKVKAEYERLEERHAGLIKEHGDSETEAGLIQTRNEIERLKQQRRFRTNFGEDVALAAEYDQRIAEARKRLEALEDARYDGMPSEVSDELGDIDVRLMTLTSGPDIDGFLASGEVDVGDGNRLVFETWGSDTQEIGWSYTRVAIVPPGGTFDDITGNNEEHSDFDGPNGVERLLKALEPSGTVARARNPEEYARLFAAGKIKKDSEGKFSRIGAVAKALLSGKPDALDGIGRESLRREAVKRGIELPRGAHADIIKDALWDHERSGVDDEAGLPVGQRRELDLSRLTVPQLKERARAEGVPKFSTMRKAQLVAALGPGGHRDRTEGAFGHLASISLFGETGPLAKRPEGWWREGEDSELLEPKAKVSGRRPRPDPDRMRDAYAGQSALFKGEEPLRGSKAWAVLEREQKLYTLGLPELRKRADAAGVKDADKHDIDGLVEELMSLDGSAGFQRYSVVSHSYVGDGDAQREKQPMSAAKSLPDIAKELRGIGGDEAGILDALKAEKLDARRLKALAYELNMDISPATKSKTAREIVLARDLALHARRTGFGHNSPPVIRDNVVPDREELAEPTTKTRRRGGDLDSVRDQIQAMRDKPVSGDREKVQALLETLSARQLDELGVHFDRRLNGTKRMKVHLLTESLIGFRLDHNAIMYGNWNGPSEYDKAVAKFGEPATTPSINVDLAADAMVANAGGSQDAGLRSILAQRGMDGPPTVVTKAELDARIAAGATELFRGVSSTPGRTKAENAEQFRTGELFVSTGGLQGSGIYATSDRPLAERYGRGGGMIRMALKPDAKTIDLDSIRAIQRREWSNWTASEQFLFGDPGRHAAALGYDAIAPTPQELASGVANFTLLNRHALWVESAPDGDIEYASRSESAAQRSKAADLADLADLADVQPGEGGEHYWTKDPEGLAKWATHEHPWAALHNHVITWDNVTPDEADRITSAWYRDVFGHMPNEGKQVKRSRDDGDGPTEDDLSRHLKDLHDQGNHGRRGVKGVVTGSTKGKPKPNEVFSPTQEVTPQHVTAAQQIYGGTFAGLTTTNITVRHAGTAGFTADGEVTNPQGVKVGEFTRKVSTDRRGELFAVHHELKLDPQVQGQGFAQAFNAALVDWYRSNDVKRIELEANIDIGGYAWARAGYDWQNAGATMGIRARIVDAMNDSPNGEANLNAVDPSRREEQRALLADILDRLTFDEFGTPEYPTPYEVSQLGRWPGAGKDDWWAGKAVMIGSEWDAVKPL